MPEPIPLPNTEIMGGEAFGQEEESVDTRYTEAHNTTMPSSAHSPMPAPTPWPPPWEMLGGHQDLRLQKMIDSGIPRPVTDVASYLSRVNLLM